MYSGGRDGNIKSKCDICFVYSKGICSCKQERIYRLHKPLIQFSHLYDGNLCCLSGVRRSCVALTKHFNLFPSFRMSSGLPVIPLRANMHVTTRFTLLHEYTIFNLYMTYNFWCNTQLYNNIVSHKLLNFANVKVIFVCLIDTVRYCGVT